MTKRRIAVLGANGRMGGAVIRLVTGMPGLILAGALTERGHATVGRDAGTVAGIDPLGVPITDQLEAALAGCDVAIDFSAAAATAGHAAACAARGCALVVGTTGLGDRELAALEAAASQVPVLYSRNMSLGVTVLTELVRQAVRMLGREFDIEIVEAHHRGKKDAPSGTALQLGEAAAAARGLSLEEVGVFGRSGLSPGRPDGAIGIAAVRGGAIVGDHTVLLAGEEELLELQHRATDRALFARGAVRAAQWLAGRPAGQYTMRQVLGLKD